MEHIGDIGMKSGDYLIRCKDGDVCDVQAMKLLNKTKYKGFNFIVIKNRGNGKATIFRINTIHAFDIEYIEENFRLATDKEAEELENLIMLRNV